MRWQVRDTGLQTIHLETVHHAYVNPVWGQKDHNSKKIMELSHDGLRLCLGRYVCHRITVTPSPFNATYDAGFFLRHQISKCRSRCGSRRKDITHRYGYVIHGCNSGQIMYRELSCSSL